MTSSDDTHGRDSRSRSGLLALIVCGLVVAGLMPLVLARVEAPERSQPLVQQVEPPRVVDLRLDPPSPEIPVVEPAPPQLPAPMPRPATKDDATAQTSRLFEKLRAIDARERARKPGANPLRDPGSQPKQKTERPRAAELLLDEFP
jgi:hypothetical protein